MNAQEKWKKEYKKAVECRAEGSLEFEYIFLLRAKRVRREAALERKLAAAQREIEAKNNEIKEWRIIRDALVWSMTDDQIALAQIEINEQIAKLQQQLASPTPPR